MPSPTNLPHELNSFVGRDPELTEVRRLLSTPTTRLLTLTGPGGCGKTRLALHAAYGLLEAFPDGVWLVELAALSDPALVPQAVASALAVREAPGSSPLDALARALHPRNLLLLLDNCEHLVDACAHLAETLLRACPHLRILATSRESLNIPGEVSWPLPPLSVPDSSHLPPQAGLVSALSQYESVRLFTDGAATIVPGFTLTEQNAHAIARICHRLDGMPLALELAAARVKTLSVEQIAARLDDSLKLLTAGPRTALPRHQTLKATIDWSYNLLTQPEQHFFRRFAVFAGSFTLAAAEAVCAHGAIGRDDALDLLSSLVSKSLVIPKEPAGAEARYDLLETVRQYASQRLAEAGEHDHIRTRHRDWYLDLAQQAEPELRGPNQFAWLDRLDVELANLRVALESSLAEEGSNEQALQLASALWWYWVFRSRWSEGRRWLDESLERDVSAVSATPARAKALATAGTLAWLQSELPVARVLLEESVTLWRDLGDGAERRHGLAYALMLLGEVVLYQGDPALARALDTESITLLRPLDDPWGLALALSCLAEATGVAGDYEAARSLISESLALFRATGDKWGLALATAQFGWLAFRQGDYATARSLFEETLPIWRQFGEKWHIASALAYLGQIAQHDNDRALAAQMYNERLLLLREMGNSKGLADCLTRLAMIAQEEAQPHRAARLLGVAGALREGRKATLPHVGDPDSLVAALRAALGEERFAAAWTEGRKMTLEEAITEAHAIETFALAVKQAPSETYPAALTPREVEVLRLIALGLTDAQVADKLVVSTRTVNSHLRSIYGKLGVTSRSAAGRFATEHNLV